MITPFPIKTCARTWRYKKCDVRRQTTYVLFCAKPCVICRLPSRELTACIFTYIVHIIKVERSEIWWDLRVAANMYSSVFIAMRICTLNLGPVGSPLYFGVESKFTSQLRWTCLWFKLPYEINLHDDTGVGPLLSSDAYRFNNHNSAGSTVKPCPC